MLHDYSIFLICKNDFSCFEKVIEPIFFNIDNIKINQAQAYILIRSDTLMRVIDFSPKFEKNANSKCVGPTDKT